MPSAFGIMNLDIVILLIFTFSLVIFTFLFLFSWIIGLIRARGVPFVPLSKKQLKDIDKHIRLKSSDRVVDLGCGDARVLRMFEKQGVKNLSGYEVNFWAYLLAKMHFKSKAKIYFKNFKKVDLSKYDVVFCYLLDYYLESLKDKFDKELKPGTKVISYAFQIKNWHKPEVIDKKIFIYTIV